MTTIVYSKKFNQIACDSQTTYSGIAINQSAEKWFNVNEATYFCTGRTLDIEKLKNHFVDSELFPTKLVKYIKLKDGNVYYGEASNNILDEEILTHDFAIGSGYQLAIMAMHLGNNAVEAISNTSIFDTNTNNNIHLFNVGN